MKVAVITPYYREPPSLLRQGHDSVLAQTHPARQVLVADGHPDPEVARWQADHVILPVAHGDIGSTPRLVGAVHAIGLGYDAIAFLDADNWFAPDHIAGLVALAQATGAGFVASNRWLCRLDGSVMAPCAQTAPGVFVDTNCMMFLRPAFPVLMDWVLMPPYAHLIGDRVIYQKLHQAGVRMAHAAARSVYYRCGRAGTYLALGETPPEGARPSPNFSRALRRWTREGNPPLPRPRHHRG